MNDELRYWWDEHSSYSALISEWLPIYPVMASGMPHHLSPRTPLTPNDCDKYFQGQAEESRLAVGLGYNDFSCVRFDKAIPGQFIASQLGDESCAIFQDGQCTYVLMRQKRSCKYQMSKTVAEFSFEILDQGFLAIPAHDDSVVRFWLREPNFELKKLSSPHSIIDKVWYAWSSHLRQVESGDADPFD